MAAVRHASVFRFYEELNEFLPPRRRKVAFRHVFAGTPSVKDRIESLGVPHTEVDLILVDGVPVDFGHRLAGGERVAVYPVFEAFELGSVNRLRPRPLRNTRFVLDVHLGRLAAYLRLLGFDCTYANDLADGQIIEISLSEHRIVLTRDTGILKDGRVTHGAFVYATDPLAQVREVLERFQLEQRTRPFTRCMRCNGRIDAISAATAGRSVPDSVSRDFKRFSRCRRCRRVYWPGSHYDRLRRKFRGIGVALEPPADP